MDFVVLSNGVKMPLVGLGTFQAKGAKVSSAVEVAIDVGYRHVDTAAVYENEKNIGVAIKKKLAQGIVKRDDLFITTKLSPFRHTITGVKQCLETSMRNLDLSYVDLYLVHYPCCYGESVDYIETWKGVEDVYKSGLAKSIGICNFNLAQITRLMEHATVKPHVLQVEANVHFHQNPILEYCSKSQICVTAFAPLGTPGLSQNGIKNDENCLSVLSEPVVISIAGAHKKTPAQVALRYLIQKQISVIPKSISPTHIEENFEIFDFELTQNEMNQIAAIPEQERLYSFNMMKARPNYPF